MSDLKQQNCGIYKITNLIDGKAYIGQSIYIKKRWKEHRFYGSEKQRNNKEAQRPLYNAMRKYGLENFTFEVLELCSPEELDEKEIYWVSYYDTYYNGYNLTLGGQQNGSSCKYDYKKIYEKYQEGYNCKELQDFFGCGDGVITNALRSFDITEMETKSKVANANKIVALSKDMKPLRVFSSARVASKYFYGVELKDAFFKEAVKTGYSLKGYYWQFLNEIIYLKKN